MAFVLDTIGAEINFNVINGMSTKEEETLVIDIVPVTFGITDIAVSFSWLTFNAEDTRLVCHIGLTIEIKSCIFNLSTVIFIKIVNLAIDVNELSLSLAMSS